MKYFYLLVLIFISDGLTRLIAQDLPDSSYTHYVIDFIIDNGHQIAKSKKDTAANNVYLSEKRGPDTSMTGQLYLININNKRYVYRKYDIISGKRFKVITDPSEVELNYEDKMNRLMVVLKSDKKVEYYFKEVKHK